jgi:hypothetical protein
MGFRGSNISTRIRVKKSCVSEDFCPWIHKGWKSSAPHVLVSHDFPSYCPPKYPQRDRGGISQHVMLSNQKKKNINIHVSPLCQRNNIHVGKNNIHSIHVDLECQRNNIHVNKYRFLAILGLTSTFCLFCVDNIHVDLQHSC